jgi:hypothetical protein
LPPRARLADGTPLWELDNEFPYHNDWASFAEAERMSFQVSRGIALVHMEKAGEAALVLDPALERLRALDADFPAQAEASFELGLVAATEGRHEPARRLPAAGRQVLKRRPFVYAYLSERERALQSVLDGNAGR